MKIDYKKGILFILLLNILSKHSKLICFTYSAIVLIIQLSDQAYFVNADWFSTIFVLSAQLSPRLGFFLSGIRLGC